MGLCLWDQYKNPYVEKIGTDENINRRAFGFYYGEEFLRKENKLLEMKQKIKIIEDLLKNEQTHREKEKLEKELIHIKDIYNKQKTNMNDKMSYVTCDLFNWTDECIQEMNVKSFTKKRKNKQSV